MRLLLSSLAALVLFSASVQAAEKPDAAKPDTKVTVAGVQVAIDPDTGAIRQPTREEIAKLIEGLRKIANTSPVGLHPVRQSNGVDVIDLDDHFMNAFIAYHDADGNLETECISSGDAAAEHLMALAACPAIDPGVK